MSSYPALALILGSGRSGTTVLYQRLCADLKCGYITSVGGMYPRLSVPSAVLSRFSQVGGQGPSNESINFFDRFDLGHTRVRLLGRPLLDTDIDDESASGFRRAISLVASAQGVGGMLMKNTGATSRVGAIAKAVPQLKFVHIVRDGRAVAASLSRVPFFRDLPLWWASGRTPSEMTSEFGSIPLVAAEHWARQCEAANNALAMLPAERRLEVRYENLIANPMETLAEVHSFLNPTIYPFRSSSGFNVSGFDSASLAKWEQQLSSDEIEAIDKRYASILRR